MTFFAWPEIESFHNIRKFAHSHPEILKGHEIVTYRSKVKLHGTNAAVQVHADGHVVAQSRTQVITEQQDNAGFAKWVKQHESEWKGLSDLVVYGEWCGPGVQKGVAISGIEKRVFVVFAMLKMNDENRTLIVDPDLISSFLVGMTDVYVLPWHTSDTRVNWSADVSVLKDVVDDINNLVESVEKSDPWVKETFGVDGTGEGLVFYPFFETKALSLNMEDFSNLVFKAKGEKHKNIKTAAPVQVDASVASGAEAFADMVLTEARLEQGAQMLQIRDGRDVYDPRSTGQFLQWIVKDVQKETQDELAASGLTWKQVEKAVQTRARNWYIEKTKQL